MSNEDLLLHMRIKHYTQSRTFNCDQCMNKYVSSEQLKEHMKCHAPQLQSFNCDQCGLVIKSNDELRIHKKTNHPNQIPKFNCDQCANHYESSEQWKEHIKCHAPQTKFFKCDQCKKSFDDIAKHTTHINSEHTNKIEPEWNCHDCPFQTEKSGELIRHLKATFHQPSQALKDSSIELDLRQCYTCQLEFLGYKNLMNHRKKTDPSNRKCKNFPNGKCIFNEHCWYVHEESLMNLDESLCVKNVVLKRKTRTL